MNVLREDMSALETVDALSGNVWEPAGNEAEEPPRRTGKRGRPPLSRLRTRSPQESAGLDVIKLYMREIRSIALLSADQEREIGRRVVHGDEEARETMIESNLRLVIAIGKRYINRGLPFQDIIEEGNLGLIRAVDKFNPEAGCRFSTYAIWWIRQSIERGISNQVRMIRLPVHVGEKLQLYTRVIRRLTQELNRDPLLEEVADAMGVSSRTVQVLAEARSDSLSLDEHRGAEDDDSLMNYIEDPRAFSPLEAWNEQLRKRRVSECLAILSETERAVLKSRYGLDGTTAQTLANIGKSIGITRERVRQIESRGLGKLRRYLDEQHLDSAALLV